jgi:5-methylcytosine-specific restriction endonuclease McrA
MMDKDKYPHNWVEIAEKIKNLAGYRCEHCGSPSIKGRILTVHHLDMNPQNCDFQNLVALCQVCHLSIQARYRPGQQFLIEKPIWAEKRRL